MIGRDILRRLSIDLRCAARAENREALLTIGGLSVACGLEVAEYLIVGAIFFDDVDDVFDWRSAAKEFGLHLSNQIIISHNGLGVLRQLAVVWFADNANVA